MEYIRNEVHAGRRHLFIELTTGDAMLSDGQGMFRRRRGPGPVQFAVIDLGEILESFDHKAPPREVFTLGEVAAMAGEKPPTVHSWVKTGILVPSMRDRDGTRGRAMLFSRLDAFVACLIASLRRKCGLPLAKLRAVSAVLRQPAASGRKSGDRRESTQEKAKRKAKQEAAS
jgi:DNA-binding transcriptional MerR regulator